MRLFRIILLVLLVLFLGAQFFRPERNNTTPDPASVIDARFPLPEQVLSLLDRSCNDCHSDNTVYPWYASVQPVGWWLAGHIDDARRHLNFDRYLTYSPRRQYHGFEEIREMVERDEMPLPSYLLIHRDAVLTDDAAAMLIAWTEAMRDSMEAWYPADSLRRPQR